MVGVITHHCRLDVSACLLTIFHFISYLNQITLLQNDGVKTDVNLCQCSQLSVLIGTVFIPSAPSSTSIPRI